MAKKKWVNEVHPIQPFIWIDITNDWTVTQRESASYMCGRSEGGGGIPWLGQASKLRVAVSGLAFDKEFRNYYPVYTDQNYPDTGSR